MSKACSTTCMRTIERMHRFKRDYRRKSRGHHGADLDERLAAIVQALATDVPLEPATMTMHSAARGPTSVTATSDRIWYSSTRSPMPRRCGSSASGRTLSSDCDVGARGRFHQLLPSSASAPFSRLCRTTVDHAIGAARSVEWLCCPSPPHYRYYGIQREVFFCSLANNATRLLRTGRGRPDLSSLPVSGIKSYGKRQFVLQ